jgi:hypothetical protein
MSHIYKQVLSGSFQRYKAIFYVAADSTPLRKDALQYVYDQWDSISRGKKVVIAGPLIDAGPHGHSHINGDATLLSGKLYFLRWLASNAQALPQRGGWDWALARQLEKQGWANLPGVVSWWNTPSVTEDSIRAVRDGGIIWLHGVKDTSALTHSRKLNL